MRFLLGLFLGALLVFAAAVFLNQLRKPTTAVEHRVAEPVNRLDTADSAEDATVPPITSLEPIRRMDVEEPHSEPQTQDLTPSLEAIEQPVAKVEGQAEPSAAAVAVAALEAPGTQQAGVASEAAQFDDAAISRGQTSQPTHLASVWAPFHSEASARGFARRLKAELDKDFTVHKAGPANYHVVFTYDDEIERSNIYAQVAQVTGQVQGTSQP